MSLMLLFRFVREAVAAAYVLSPPRPTYKPALLVECFFGSGLSTYGPREKIG